MSEEREEGQQDPQEIQAFLQRLSRDKHAFGAHLGMHVDRDFSRLEEHERIRAQKASQWKEKQKKR